MKGLTRYTKGRIECGPGLPPLQPLDDHDCHIIRLQGAPNVRPDCLNDAVDDVGRVFGPVRSDHRGELCFAELRALEVYRFRYSVGIHYDDATGEEWNDFFLEGEVLDNAQDNSAGS